MAAYPTAPLKCWQKAKELKADYFIKAARAKAGKGLLWMGSTWAFDAVPAGLGDDVVCLTGEPYGAACATDRPLSAKFLGAAEDFGFSRDLCAYMRNYWGSVLMDQYVYGGKFPTPDFAWTQHICCSHGKWYQNAAALEGGLPVYVVDVGAGPCPPFAPELFPHRVDYVAGQLLDGIEWLERITGRKFDDEKFIRAAWNDICSTRRWADICMLNRSRPAPLDEKTMYSLYVFGTLNKANTEFARFLDEVYDEVRDRQEKGIAAAGSEKRRIMSDCQPPWGFLQIYRYMESRGVVSIGSFYTFAVAGMWEYDPAGNDFFPKPLPDRKPGTREECCRMLAQWHLCRPSYQHFYSPEYKTRMMDAIARRWDVDGILMHYNRGCEGLAAGIAENRLGLLARGHTVMTYEGNMGDGKEFDETVTKQRLDQFMAELG